MGLDKYEDLARLARSALVIAAKRRSLVTYGELGDAIGMSGVALAHEMRRVLDLISRDDREAGRSGDRGARRGLERREPVVAE